MNYDFSQLSPIEFEKLVNDLLEKKYRVSIERFKEWRDRGIDWRFEYGNWKKAIIQTKHYYKSWYKWLKSVLEKKVKSHNWINENIWELVKVENLKNKWELDKYIFATSVWLSPDNKKEIFNIFAWYIEKESDIFWVDELNSILLENKDLEDKYYKLWINSTNVLKTIFSNIIYNDILWRSNDEVEKYIEKNKYFYPTEDFNKAIKILSKNNVLIITWEPWIWKSTLSEQLCLRFISKWEFKFFKISKNINEVEKIWQDDDKQIFYFDDFLWSNYLEKIDWKDSNIKNFIERIKRVKLNKNIEDKIFILNSRTTIIKSWIENSSISWFKEDIEENEFILRINQMIKEEKAYILYNHLYYWDLEEDYINKIYENKNYRKIINHTNYSPRLIEFITNKKRVTVDKDKYIDFILNNLDNPTEIWRQVFEKQSNNYVNYLVYLTVFNQWKISEEIIKNRYNIFVKKINHWIIPINYEFDNVQKISIENFLVRKEEELWKAYYSLINPSITDYILHKYISNSDFLIDFYYDLWTYDWLRELYNLYRNWVNKNRNLFNIFPFSKKIKDTIKMNSGIYLDIINWLYKKWLDGKSNDYIIYLLDLNSNKTYDKSIYNFLQWFIDNYIDIDKRNIDKLFKLISENYENLNIINSNFLIQYIKKWDIDKITIDYIWEILNNIYDDEDFIWYDQELLDILEEEIIMLYENETEDVFDNVSFDDYINDYEDAIDFNIVTLIDEKISEIEWTFNFSKFRFMEYITEIDVEDIYDWLWIDLEDKYKDYRSSLNYDNEENYDKYRESEKDRKLNINSDDFDEVDYIFTKK